MSTRSTGLPAGPARKAAAPAVLVRTSGSPRARMFASHTLVAARAQSTRVTSAAPRLAASRPRAPEPAHRSSTRASSIIP